GLIVAMTAKAMGAARGVVIGRSSSARRLELAEKLGIEAWNSDTADVTAAAAELTDGCGLDVVVEASGGSDAIAAGLGMLRRRGRMCVLGVTGRSSIEVPWDTALTKAADLRFSMSSSYTSWDRALALIDSARVDVQPLITTFALSDWQAAFQAVEDRHVVKAVLVP